MPESNTLLLYRACITALLTPGKAEFLDGYYIYSRTPLGRFELNTHFDGLHVARRTKSSNSPEQQAAESWRLLGTGRSCLTIKCETTSDYLLLYPEDMRNQGIKGLVANAIGNHPHSEDEPVIFHGDRIIWDPFTDPYLREIYTHLTSGQ